MRDLNHQLNYLSNNYNVIWCGIRIEDYISINDLLPIASSITYNHGVGIEKIFPKIKFFSLEKEYNHRYDWNSKRLTTIERKTYRDFIENSIYKTSKQTLILAYSPSSELDKIQKKHANKIKIIANKHLLKKKLDDKFFIKKELIKRGIDTIPTIYADINGIDIDFIIKKIGLPLVIGEKISNGGANVHLIMNKKSFEKLKCKSKYVGISPYIKGIPINVNAVIYNNSIFARSPSIQLIGHPLCTNRKFGYCGNDFETASKVISGKVKKTILNLINVIGEFLFSFGYKGFFGVDLLLTKDKVLFVELNPRMQSSTHLMTELELFNNEIPLFLIHLLSFLELKEFNECINSIKNNIFYKNLKGSLINIYSLKERISTITEPLISGSYLVKNDQLIFQDSATSINKIDSNHSFVLDVGIPYNSTLIEPNSLIYRLKFQKGILSNDLKDIDISTKKIISKISELVV